jgi:ParB-like chromosome segregation protein Spo0J
VTFAAPPLAIPIDRIVIGERHRRDLGDIDGLAKSIWAVGLLHPIVIDTHGRLIAGERRLNAARQLGWAEVPVRVVNLDQIVLGEFAENAQRKDFLPSEIDAIRRTIEPIEREAARQRMSEGGKVGKISTPSGKTRDKVGAFAGVSGRTVEKIAAIVTAAEAEPQRFRPLVEQMDRTRKVDSAYRRFLQLCDEERIQKLVPVIGSFRP